MHIYELALRTLLMGFDADADADARFVFPRLASVVDSAGGRLTGSGGGGR